MDGILKCVEHQLEMLDARLERLQPALPTDVWRWAAWVLLPAPPPSTYAPCDRDVRRLCGLCARRSLVFELAVHCSAPPDPLVGVAREVRGKEPRRAIQRLAPRVWILCLKLRASAGLRFGGFRVRA